MAASISEVKVLPNRINSVFDRINWIYPTLALVAFFTFSQLGQAPVRAGSEAATGIRAIEILQYNDWIHKQGEPEQALSNPPLAAGMAAFHFYLFGYSTFSLRLHSAIATLFIFFFLFQIIHLYRPALFAFAVCLTLISVKALIGPEIGRNGGDGAVMIAFLLGGLYYFLRYMDFMRYHDIFIAAVLWGLALWTKGPAFALIIPGIVLYLLLDNRLLHVLRLREIYKAGFIMAAFPLLWFLISYLWGFQPEHSRMNGYRLFGQVFLQDLADLFTGPAVKGSMTGPDPWYLWKVLRENFRNWDIVFYGLVLLGIVKRIATGYPKWAPHQYRLILLSVCIWLSLSLLFSWGPSAEFRHFAPAIPFVAITTTGGIWWIYRNYPALTLVLFSIFWVFCLYDRYWGPGSSANERLNGRDVSTSVISKGQHQLAEAARIYQIGKRPEQEDLLRLYFVNPNIVSGTVGEIQNDTTGNLSIFMQREEWEKERLLLEDFQLVAEDDQYILLEKNR